MVTPTGRLGTGQAEAYGIGNFNGSPRAPGPFLWKIRNASRCKKLTVSRKLLIRQRLVGKNE